jgi:hypothetical protein
MKTFLRGRELALLAVGIAFGVALAYGMHAFSRTSTVMAQTPAPDLAAMQADIAHLKEVVPSQSHTMTDVGFQFSNLWFAGKQKNWPLADFYLNEARQHIVWTIRIRPIRKDAAGNPVDLKAMFDVISDGPLKKLTASIQNKDEDQFTSAYKQMLNGCYGCHVASGKPFLRPVVPQTPPQSLITFEPQADN